MTKRFLIVEPDRVASDRLVEALTELYGGEVTVARKTKLACQRLSQAPRDLAIIPMLKSDKLVRILRLVQPDLKLVVMVRRKDESIPESYAHLVQGVLPRSYQKPDLARVIDDALGQPSPVEEDTVEPDDGTGPLLDTASVIGILQQARMGRLIQAAVFSAGTRLLAHWGALEGAQAATVAMVAASEWGDSTHTVRVQFINLPARAGDMLLHTRRVDNVHFLTLVSRPETPLSELRMESDSLLGSLLEMFAHKKMAETSMLDEDEDEKAETESYAIAWRPVEPLSPALHIPLRRSLARLAATNDCTLIQIEVRPELIHLVVACPPDRDSTWAAYLFKNGSEATIQQEFGLKDSLWEAGYHAIESKDPLSEAELNLFLEREITE